MNLKKPLHAIVPENMVNQILRGYEVIGDVAILSIDPRYSHLELKIAASILNAYPALRLVAKRLSDHSGEFRISSLQKIDGCGEFDTVHKEFGLKLHVDPGAVYFSPRSGGERFRVAQLVKAGERVLVMFSGIGPFALMIGVHSEAAEIVGVEKNPCAHRLALKNVEENKKAKNVAFYCGDVLNILPGLNKIFDRIVMPLPLSGADYLRFALRYLASGGVLHFYDFRYRDDFDSAVEPIRSACRVEGRGVADSEIHQCGHVSSRRYRVCVDAIIS